MQQEESHKYIPTDNALKVLERRYLISDSTGNIIETPDEMMIRVAGTMASVEDKSRQEEFRGEFYKVLSSGMFLPNSPTLMNAGTKTNMLSACFVIPVEDDMGSILQAVANTGTIFKLGGGVGLNFSHLRPEGSFIHSTGGYSSGPVSFMRIFNTLTKVIAQGGRRRGALMGILSVEHPDILSFINAKTEAKKLTGFNLSVGVTDAFMRAVLKNPNRTHMVTDPTTGEKKGLLDKDGKSVTIKQLFDLITLRSWESGEPGIIFIDRLQKYNPIPGLIIECTNPCGEVPLPPWGSCLTGDTKVLTLEGVRTIDYLFKNNLGDNCIYSTDNKFRIFHSVVHKGTKNVYKVKLANGYEIEATPDHKFSVDGHMTCVEDLEIGYPIDISSEYPLPIFGHYSEMYEMYGWMHGDGWYTDSSLGISFNHNDKDSDAMERLLPLFHEVFSTTFIKPLKDDEVSYQVQTATISAFNKCERLSFVKARACDKELPTRFFEWDGLNQISFIRGLFGADAGVAGKSNSQVHFASTSLKIINQVQQFLSSIGIQSRISITNFRQELNRKSQYKLIISKRSAEIYMNVIGFSTKHKNEKFAIGKRYTDDLSSPIMSIKYTGKKDVYDVMEVHETNTFFANGMATHNCNLGSVNLSKFVNVEGHFMYQELKKVIYTAVRFLDNVIEMNEYPLPQIKETAHKTRNIGLGVMGLADAFFKMKIPYNSPEALKKAETIMEFIQRTGHEASEALGKEKGNFPLFKESIWTKHYSHHRNGTVTVIAPTGSIAIINACSGGIEPLFSLIFRRMILDRDIMFEVSPIFKTMLAERNVGLSESDMKQIYEEGTCKNITCIPEDLKAIFACSHDVEPEYHLKMQEAFQKYTDCSVSKTINLPHNATLDTVKEVYKFAFKSKVLKGLTVYRDGSRLDQPMQLESSLKEKTPSKYAWFLQLIEATEKKGSISPAVKIKQNTPFGTLHVTLVFDKNMNEKEVFAQLGKSGDVAGADLEAICRLSSKLLQNKYKFDDLIKQLIDIGTSLSLPTAEGKVVSLPDGLAKALSSYEEVKLKVLSEEKSGTSKAHDVNLYKVKCPSCSSGNLIYEEGCGHCDTCDYALC